MPKEHRANIKIVIVGHVGSYNRGCEAIIRSTLIMLRQEFKDPKIIISAFDYKNEKNVDYGPNVIFTSAESLDTWKKLTWDWFIRKFHFFSNRESWEFSYLPIFRYLKAADVVISVGGDNYSMDYGFPAYFLNLNKLVKKFRKKLVIWGASIGPFPENDRLEEIVKNLKEVDLIAVRENETFAYLKSLGIDKNVKLVADPAFILPLAEVPMESMGIDCQPPVLGFNISPILAAYTNKVTEKDIISGSISFLDNVIRNMKMQVFLIPHVTKDKSRNNDYIFMAPIYESLKNTKMIHRVASGYNAMQTKYIISKCDFFIGARTHATIAALSSCVPTISIGYSLKSKGINNDIFGNEDLLINVKDFSAENMNSKFMYMFNNKAQIKDNLFKKIPYMKEMAWKNAKYLKMLWS